MRDVNLFTYKYIEHYNIYRSANDLGLIYATESEYLNINSATKFLKDAGFSDYPIGQNNLGLLYQFYLNRIVDAKNMFVNASKNKLSLAEFNLGYIEEKEGNYKEMIDHYILASKYENKPFRYKNQLIDDERLEISKTFIIFITNLKIANYFLSQEKNKLNAENVDNYLIKALFQPLLKLLYQKNNKSYSFQFKYDIQTNKITNLNDFFFNCPLFKYSIPTESNWTEINSNHLNKTIILNIKEEIKEFEQNDQINNLKEMSANYSDTIKKPIDKSTNPGFDVNNKTTMHNLLFEIMKNNNFMLNEVNNYKDKILIKLKKEDIECSLDYPKKIFSKLFKSVNNVNHEIDDVIQEGMKILYEPPYNILLGRIKITEPLKKISKNISKDFYDGFDCSNQFI